MVIRAYRTSDEGAVMSLWEACGLTLDTLPAMSEAVVPYRRIGDADPARCCPIRSPRPRTLH